MGVVSDNSHINLQSNSIITQNQSLSGINVIYLNRSISLQKNNKFNTNNKYYFNNKNTKNFVSSVQDNPISGQYMTIIENSIYNFSDLTYNCEFILNETKTQILSEPFKTFYNDSHIWMHNAASISILSPIFANDGNITTFSGNQNQQLLTNLDFEITDYSYTEIKKIQDFLNNFPKNLNGYVLTFKFNNIQNTIQNKSTLKISGFDAGTIKIYGYSKNNYKYLPITLEIQKCNIVQVKNIIFKHTNINIKNCNNIVFDKIKYYQDNNYTFNAESSNILVKNSDLYLLKTNYLGTITDNSKVYIHETCATYIDNQKQIDTNIKKFNVSKNSQVSWFTYDDDIMRLMLNQQNEFTDNIATNELKTSNSFKNHIHASFPLQHVVTNIDTYNSIISAMPVGSTFYWPRAFRFSNLKDKNRFNTI